MKRIKVKRLSPNAVFPQQSGVGNVGFDLTAVSVHYETKYIEYDTAIAVEIPENHVGLLFPRSSISKYDLSLANAVGVIDPSYRGPIRFRFKKLEHSPEFTERTIYKPGDRIGQLIILPVPAYIFQEVENLSDTDRGTQGFGSTGV